MASEEIKNELRKIIDKIGNEDLLHIYIALDKLKYQIRNDEELQQIIENNEELQQMINENGELRDFCILNRIIKRPESVSLTLFGREGTSVYGEIKENGETRKLDSEEFSTFEKIVGKFNTHDNYLGRYSNDEVVMTYAIKNNSIAIRYIGDKLKNNKEFILSIINTNLLDTTGMAYYPLLDIIKENFSKDKEVLLSFIKRDSQILFWADDSLKKDEEFVLEIAKNGGTMGYCDDSLKANEKFMLECIKANGQSIMNVSPELKDNIDFMRQALLLAGKFEPMYLFEGVRPLTIKDYIPSELQNDETFMKEFEESRENLKKPKYSAQDIANNISPRQGEIQEVLNETIAEQEKAMEINDENKCWGVK